MVASSARLRTAPALAWLSLSLAVLLFAVPPARAFRGTGRRSLVRAQALITQRASTLQESRELAEMDPVDRLVEALEALGEAEALSTSPREDELIQNYYRAAYNRLGEQYAARKDYASAVWALESAIERGGEENAILHFNLGVYRSQAGDPYGASSALERARDLTEDPGQLKTVRRLLIREYFRLGELNDSSGFGYAIDEIEAALADAAGDFGLLMLLGRAHLLRGDQEEALQAWDRARRVGTLSEAQMAEYAKVRDSLSVKTKKEFVRDESQHFIVEFDDDRHAGLAQRLLDLLEEAHAILGTRYGVRPSGGQKLFVSVYTSDQFSLAVKVPWAAGVQQANRIDLKLHPELSFEQLRDTVHHEYVHHLIHLRAGQRHVPSWLNEGLAMLAETSLDTRPFARALGQAITRGQLLSLETLSKGFVGLPSEQVLLAYAQGYGFTRALVERHGQERLLAVLDALAEAQPFEMAFRERVGAPLVDEYQRWVGQMKERLQSRRHRSGEGQPSAGDLPRTR